MGNFIEDLRSQKAAEEQAIAEKNAERERASGLERAKEEREEKQKAIERNIREENWKKAKGYFEQTGIRQIAQELIDIKAAYRFQEDDIDCLSLQEDVAYRPSLIIEWNVSRGYFRCVEIAVSPDGVVSLEGEKRETQIVTRYEKGFVGLSKKKIEFKEETITPLIISIDNKQWQGNRSILEEAFGKIYNNPKRITEHPHDFSHHYGEDFSHCLPGNSSISAPNGFISAKHLKIGYSVWTIDRFNNKVKEIITKTNKRRVSKGHKMAHIILEDGRKLIVSPGHPTIDNKELGSLKKGQLLDNSKIISIQIMPYKEKYTYDILPFGDTGAYWANGIPIGSTLSNQFREAQEKKFNQQSPWYRRLFASF